MFSKRYFADVEQLGIKNPLSKTVGSVAENNQHSIIFRMSKTMDSTICFSKK